MQALLQAIATVRDRIQRHGTLCASSEFQTRYGLIDPILRALEWDVSNPDEVRVNYAMKADDDSAVSGWADYVLMHQNKPRVVIKAIVHGQWDSSAYVQGTNTNRQAKVHKKQQLMTPSLRFPLRAGGTAWARGLVPPREAGGTCRRGQFMNFGRAIGIRTSIFGRCCSRRGRVALRLRMW